MTRLLPTFLAMLPVLISLTTAIPFPHRSLSVRQVTGKCDSNEVPDCCEITSPSRRWARPSPQNSEFPSYYEVEDDVVDPDADNLLLAGSSHAADTCGSLMEPCCRPKAKPAPSTSSEPEPLPNHKEPLVRHGST